MANKLVWGADLYKGFKVPQNASLNGQVDDLTPFQMLTQEEKTDDWIRAVADFYETCGWNNVEKKAGQIQKDFDIRNGKLDMSDYVLNPNLSPAFAAMGISAPEAENIFRKHYALADKFVDLLRGEFIKRDNSWGIEAVDPHSVDEVFKDKEEKFKEVIYQYAMLEKQQTLERMGLSEESDPEEYQNQVEAFSQQLQEVELKSKNFRTTGVKWAEKVLRIHEKRYNLKELEPDSFDVGLTTDLSFWHLDLLDDDFKVELLNPKWCDYHKGPGKKYVSDGDYFLWFDWMSAGDVVNTFGRRMKEKDLLKLKDIHFKTANMVVPDAKKPYQDGYYDYNKKWADATDLDPKMNDALLGKELAYSFMRSPNFDHNIEVDILNPTWGKYKTGKPQMFRVMRLYWRSMKRIGWLTKINRDGSLAQAPDWVDENFKVTEEPVYDNSVVKQKTKDNLLYGEHIDWTWTTDWRYVIKISPNQKHTFWLNSTNEFTSIYIGGESVKYQFRGKNNPFDALPPVEGCEYSYFNAGRRSFVRSISSFQVLYNIAMNKVPRKFFADKGNKVAIDTRLMHQPSLSAYTDLVDPVEAYDEMLDKSDILPYKLSREAMEGMGNPALPSVLALSTAQEAQFYLQIADSIKWMAGENVGITRQRMGGQKPSETATSVQQGIVYSETQTEPLFEQHYNLMERVRQRMLDATQYYSTLNESNRVYYLNDKNENIFLEIEGMENTLPHYNIWLQSRANIRSALQKIGDYLMNNNTDNIPGSVKIQALVDQSINNIVSIMKTAEDQAMQDAERGRQHELALEQERRQTLLAQIQEQQKFQEGLANKKNQTDIEVAEIRAMGGIQTDVNTNMVPDAQENLDYLLKQQQLSQQAKDNQLKTNVDRQNKMDDMMIAREQMQTDMQKEHLKSETAKFVAKQNKNKYDKKK